MRNRYVLITAIVVALCLIAVVALFVVQNSARTTQLSLDLHFWAWQLSQPVSIPALIGLCTGGGFVVGAVVFLGRSMSLSRRLRRLEQEAALSGESKW